MSLRILRPGLLSTVQDRGRYGLQHLGVVPCGPMDPVAFELANALVGNRDGEAALEITVLGPEIEFECDALVAICGAQFDATRASDIASRFIMPKPDEDKREHTASLRENGRSCNFG